MAVDELLFLPGTPHAERHGVACPEPPPRKIRAEGDVDSDNGVGARDCGDRDFEGGGPLSRSAARSEVVVVVSGGVRRFGWNRRGCCEWWGRSGAIHRPNTNTYKVCVC